MSEIILNYLQALVDLTKDMAPYLLLGFLFAGLLKVFLPQNLMNKYLGKSNFNSVLNASLLGIPLPLCSCGVLPAGISLYNNGASKGSSVSFLISTPQTGVDSILVTWSMLGLPFALIRPVAALVTGLTGGLLTNRFEKNSTHKKKEKVAVEQTFKPKKTLKAVLDYAFIEMVADIAKWLVIGLLIAAFIAVAIPDNFFTDFKLTGLLGMLIILVVSIPLYVCATSSVPIAAVLLLKGLSPGTLLVFLMAGPATNAATMTVIANNFGKKTLFIYLAALISGSILFGLIIDYFLPVNWFAPILGMGEHHHSFLPEWLNISSAVLLTLLIAYYFVKNIFNKMNTSKSLDPQGFSIEVPSLEINVEGMTCEHCKNRVETGLKSMQNIGNAVANPETNRVKIFGKDLNLEQIGQKITDLGYIFGGKV
ncbi:MAG TPA: permease [Bacteroidales bacterium]